ncbi:MAG TPA: hypothetical protein VK504_20300 [Vicinamibacterales bacterium]|nr:hypothetical protein [Vicinamibacterales bacterium]
MKIDVLGGSSLVTLGDVAGWTLGMATPRAVVTAFGDTNVRRVAGLPDFTGDLTSWWNAVATSSPAYFAAVLAGTPVTLKLIPNTLDPTVYFQGLANVDGGLDVSATGAISSKGKWDAASNWVMAP